MSIKLRCIEGKHGQCVDLGLPRLEEGISCTCGHVIYCIGAVLTQVDEEELDHPIPFASWNLSKADKNY